MSKPISFHKLATILLFCSVAIGFVSGDDDDEQKQVITRDSINLTVPNPFGDRPIFETNDQNGRYIGINIPMLFDLELHYRGGLMDTKIKMSLLSGLMRLNYDRVKLADGQRGGPIQFSALGFSLYDNNEQPYA